MSQPNQGKETAWLDSSLMHPPTPSSAEQGNNNDLTSKNTVNNFGGNSLLSRVLQFRQLQSADQLFTVSDYEIITELHSALFGIKQIFNDPMYVKKANDQSVVELVLSRLTAAIRETSCIETYAPALVDVLEAALVHPMYAINSTTTQLQDSPHCKIASEILSTLFMYHCKKSVMTVAIPIAVKALSNANQDLVRNTTSYLSLAAIHNGRLLAQFSIQIIWNIINGNYSLVRVLPQVYPQNREPFHAHLSPLFRLLHYSSTDISEKLSLLQLASMITNSKPELIVPHLSEFDEFLMSPTTCTAVLHIHISMISMNRVNSLVGQLLPLRRAVRIHSPTQNNLAAMGKIIGCIGRSTNEKTAAVVVQDLVNILAKCSPQNFPILMKEIEGVAEVWPSIVLPHLDAIKELSEHNSSNYSAYLRIKALSDQAETRKNNLSGSISTAASVVLESANGFIDSAESLKKSYSAFPSDPTPAKINTNLSTAFNGSAKQPPIKWSTENSSIAELQSESLDKKMEDLAVSYKMRSNGSLGVGNPKSRSFMSLTNSNHSQLHNNNNNNHLQQERLSRCSILEEQQAATVALNHPASSFAAKTQTLSREPRVTKPVLHNQPPTYAQATQQPQQERHSPKNSMAEHHNAAMQLQYGTILQQILPHPPTSKSNASVVPFVHLGKDGRVRPVSKQSTNRNRSTLASNWVPSSTSLATSLPSYEETTIFPVNASASVVQTTSNAAGRSRLHNTLDGTMSGSFTQSSKIYVDEQSRYLRPQSADLMSLGAQTMPMAAGRRGRTTHGRANDLWRNSIEGRGDLVKQFVENRAQKIQKYVTELTLKYPIPVRCTVEGSKGTKSRMRVHFSCQTNGLYCIFDSLHNLFAFKTHIAPVWLHLMFLQVEARSIEINGKVLSQESDEFRTLDHCWKCLSKEVTRNKPFVTLVTSAFPSFKEQCKMLKELQESRFFDSFNYNAQINKWSCFSCSYPEKVQSLLRIDEADVPLLEGQLKEKRGRWRLFKRWQTKYFLLSSAALVCSDKSSFDTSVTGATKLINPSIALRNIRSVKSLSRGRKSRKSLPKSFELCTDDQVSYVLKASDRKQAEEWFHCLQIAVAQAQREKI